MFNDTRKKHVAIAPSFGCKLSFLRSTESNIKWGSVANDRENHPPGKRRRRAPTGMETPARRVAVLTAPAGRARRTRVHWGGRHREAGPEAPFRGVVTESEEPRSSICESPLCRGLCEHTVARRLAMFVLFLHPKPKLRIVASLTHVPAGSGPADWALRGPPRALIAMSMMSDPCRQLRRPYPVVTSPR